ncbi:MAG: hypothetical protein H6709_04850 [Kofleriaceae bacterium]|nr:hypothetical protein [Myxococcales bacterium]MCB9559788.1 hypothetical protein [Kofleriaceae bacterium]MCB9571399.1 hypothetical protein [Kofleriaceae bacterium]
MTVIEMSGAEVDALLDLLEVNLSGLRVEIGRTDHRDYKQRLQNRYDVLEMARRRFEDITRARNLAVPTD